MSAPLIRAVAVAAALGLLSVAPPATPAAPVSAAERAEYAGRAQVEVSIKLSDDGRKLLGKVTSSRRSCTVARRVKLFWLEPGYDDYLFVAGDKTDTEGKWKIKHPERRRIPEGKYYVRVGRTDGCDAARSRVITVR